MKRLFTAILVVCLVLSLAACGGSNPKDDAITPEDETTPDTNGNPENTENDTAAQPATLGFYDPNFDYTQYDSFKIGHISLMNDTLTLEYDRCYQKWAERLNMDYTPLYSVTSYSMDDFLSVLQTYADQGYDGVVLSPDATAYERVIEICEENDMYFFPHLGVARDYSGDMRLLAPMCGYDQESLGVEMANKLIEWKDETYPDASWDDVGFISVTWSLSTDIQLRCDKEEEVWSEKNPSFGAYDVDLNVNPKNFFIADTATGNSDQVTAQNLTTQIISANSNIKIWLVAACADYYAIGATNAILNLNMNDNCCIVSNGGTDLRDYFDKGVETAWRYAFTGPASLFTECPINALWAYCTGLATPETIFGDYVDPNDKGDVVDSDGNVMEEHSYAKVLLRSEWIDIDNYKDYLEWADFYLFGEDEADEGLYQYDKVNDINKFVAYDPSPYVQ